MYSVKPGRGPSFMGGVGSILAAVFGVVWMIGAASMGAPPFFVLFGLVFVGMAIAQAVYNFYNAVGRDRVSTFDITTGDEEDDPIARALGHGHSSRPESTGGRRGVARRYPGGHCPFCGTRVEEDFDYCPKCGKDI